MKEAFDSKTRQNCIYNSLKHDTCVRSIVLFPAHTQSAVGGALIRNLTEIIALEASSHHSLAFSKTPISAFYSEIIRA